MNIDQDKAKIVVRAAQERGHIKFEWLDTYHTFSFGEYYDPKHMQFRTLRVINDDVVAGGQGFGMHPHKDMEIVTYIISGSLKHKDSMGNEGIIARGEVQKMSAGKGVLHSEVNASDKEKVHLIQIWIIPEKTGLTPSYGQIKLDSLKSDSPLKLFASKDGGKDMIQMHQDVKIYQGLFQTKQTTVYNIEKDRGVWIQMIKGTILAAGKPLSAGDGVQIENTTSVELKALEDAEFLLFDLK